MKKRIEQLDGRESFADFVGRFLGAFGLALVGALAATLFGPWVVIFGVFAWWIGVMAWLVAMLFQSEKGEVRIGSDADDMEVRGFSECPECGEGRWYEHDRHEVCGGCLVRMMMAEGFDVEGGGR